MIKEKWIIDTDPGCDDMFCLFYMFSKKEIDIQMISLVEGNTTMENICKNIKKIVKISKRKDIPIFKGGHPILVGGPTAAIAHMADGLGDVPDLINLNADEVPISEGYSPLKIIELIHTYPNEINLLFIGPLTNLAIAYMINPDIVNLVKSVYIMGGSFKSRGNILPSTEFNFAYDCLAPSVVLNNFHNLIIVPWEAVEDHIITHEDIQKLNTLDFSYHEVYYYIEKLLHRFSLLKRGIKICDFYCAICTLNPSIVKKCFVANVNSTPDSNLMRGVLTFNNKKIYSEFKIALDEIKSNKKKVLIVEQLDFNVILTELRSIFI